MNAREIALSMLVDILEEKKLSHLVINDGLKKAAELEKQDRAFISRLVTGCVEFKITLDYDIDRFSKVKVAKMKPLIRNILRMGVYQLKYMTQIPDSAVCNEAVKLAKKRGLAGLSGFVNGILRAMVRQKDVLMSMPEKMKEADLLSYEFSTPLWLVNFWKKRFGIENTRKILESYRAEKETTIRCDLNKVSVEKLKEILVNEGVEVEGGHILPEALRIKNYDSLERLASFAQGLYTVQDESSMLVGKIAGVKDNDQIIDVCAAPGGKSIHVAQLLHGTGHVRSFDKTQRKADLIAENASRLGIKNLTAKVSDALIPNEELKESADVVIADLPCSGLGVIGKKPDIKYNMTWDAMKELAQLQKDILKVVTSYVKPGKILIYSTCTINPMENEENVEFLKTLGFELEDLNPYLPEKMWSETTKAGYLQVLPYQWNTDGFFIARLRKR
ncbi:MAG: 16S rRNA (cytosine(967)-C(5))-methyltransferase RsmB [Clostridiales bacterium]|nr:16S rRNA (cytosine(967)-C(5))-methyltransferase RsmB [Clostridiales bacterium]